MDGWLPAVESKFDGFYSNFAEKIAVDPAAYGLTSADGAALAADFEAWNAAYLNGTQPTTRTRGTVQAKNQQKKASRTLIRSVAAKVRVNGDVPVELKVGLGLHVGGGSASPVPPPATKPALWIAKIDTRMHRVRAKDEASPGRRGRPRGVAGLLLYRVVSDEAVNNPAGAEFVGFMGKADAACTFTSADRGKVATYFARWTNGKGEMGPWSQAVSAPIAA